MSHKTETTQDVPATKMALTNVSLSFSIISSQTTTLSIGDIEAGFIVTGSTTPNGNNPSGYGNTLFAWKGVTVPFGQAPVASGAASGNLITGNFDAENYVVGYSVGPAVTSGSPAVTTYPNVAATAAIPANWNLNNVTYFGPSLSISALQTSFISFTYSLPAGVNPSANGAYIALWNGNQSNPYGMAPANTAAITATTNQGAAPMTGLTTITPNGVYTAALFTSGYSSTPTSLNLTTIAYVIVFTTSSSLV
jgi:hypothetical protein